MKSTTGCRANVMHCTLHDKSSLLFFALLYSNVVLVHSQKKETPLHIASRVKDGEKCAEMLIKSGADVNAAQEVSHASGNVMQSISTINATLPTVSMALLYQNKSHSLDA